MGCATLAPSGYDGQDYEIVAVNREGQPESIGWANDDRGGELARGVRLWPRYIGYDVVEVATGAVVYAWRRDA